MTIRQALSRHLPPPIKRLIRTVIRRRPSRVGVSWRSTLADLKVGDTVVLVANVGELAHLSSDDRRLIQRARAKGHSVELYVLDFDVGVPLPALPVHAVRRFYADAAPPADPPSRKGMSIPSELDEAPYPLTEGEWATGYYRNGQPTLVVTRHPGGTRLEHLDSSGQTVRRDEFDGDGELVRYVDLHPRTGKAVVHRYLDSSGRTWLRVHVGTEGPGHPVRQFDPVSRDYGSLADVQEAWLRDRLRHVDRARILACGKSSQLIVQRLQTAGSSLERDLPSPNTGDQITS